MLPKKPNVLYEVGLNAYKVDPAPLIYENRAHPMHKLFPEFPKPFVYHYAYYNKLKINYAIR